MRAAIHMAVLIGSQCGTVIVSRYYFRINRISDRIRYSNTGIDPDRQAARMQRCIHTRVVDSDHGILRFHVCITQRIIINIRLILD